MNIMNHLIAKIITAKGGTVTDEQSRNELLRDWLLIS